MDNWNAVLTNLLSDQKANILVLSPRNDEKNHNFQGKRPSKNSSGHVNCILDNLVEENLTKGHQCLPQCPKLMKRHFFQKADRWFYSESFNGHVKCSFDNPAEQG